MNNRLKACIQRLDPAAIAFAAIPALLYLPVLRYSLDTPFGLIDDYLIWKFIHIFDWFLHWLYIEFIVFDYSYSQPDIEWIGGPWENLRHRPFWELYNAVTWKVFGHIPWLHHLARWAAHFGAVAVFAAAYLCFQRRNKRNQGSNSVAAHPLIRLLPLTALVYLWLFFPNQPAARLGTQGAISAFFLGLCVWMTALTLTRQGKPQTRRSALLTYAAFCVGFCGLAWTKETNIAAALWLLLSYYALPMIEALRRQAGPRISAIRALKGISAWRALGGLPLIAVFAHTAVKLYFVSQEGGYGAAPITWDLLTGNAAWIAEGLFQARASLIITIGLALLSAALLLFVVVNIARKRFSAELVFALFLLGLFVSSYLIFCASWIRAIRYWHTLIPVFTTLLAFAIKFILEFAAARQQAKRAARSNFARIRLSQRNLAAYAITAFIAFFVCCNYYNFLYQTVVQHIARHNDANLIAEITRLHHEGQYIQNLDTDYYYTHELATYFHEFLPRFYGREYDIHSEPPQEAGHPYYIVKYIRDRKDTYFSQVSRLPEIERNYRPLAYAYHMADFLQVGSPYRVRDLGGRVALWQIYDDEVNRIWLNGDVLDVRQIAAQSAPLIRSDFDVYLNARRLIYINERCSASDLDNTFFLAVFPLDAADLPKSRRPLGFENLDFDFANYGFVSGERCFIVRELPEYPIDRIHTGQLIDAEGGYHHTWEGEAVLSDE